MADCRGCGANVEFGSYSCSYCGSLVGEQRDTLANEPVHGQLTNKFSKIETKLDELLVMPLPTYWHMIVTPFRWYVIIATLGIAAFFWRKPKQKETFDSKRFHVLKTQIEREIAIIDSGAKSSPELKARLDLFRGELKKITDRLLYGRILNMTPLILIAADEAESMQDAAKFARKVRRRLGLSQAEFSQRIDVSLDTIRNWEQGKRCPTGAAKALLKILDKAPEAALAALH